MEHLLQIFDARVKKMWKNGINGKIAHGALIIRSICFTQEVIQ